MSGRVYLCACVRGRGGGGEKGDAGGQPYIPLELVEGDVSGGQQQERRGGRQVGQQHPQRHPQLGWSSGPPAPRMPHPSAPTPT